MNREEAAAHMLFLLGSADIRIVPTPSIMSEAILAVHSDPGVVYCGMRAFVRMRQSLAVVDALIESVFK